MEIHSGLPVTAAGVGETPADPPDSPAHTQACLPNMRTARFGPEDFVSHGFNRERTEYVTLSPAIDRGLSSPVTLGQMETLTIGYNF